MITTDHCSFHDPYLIPFTPASWGKLMKNKKNNSASTFADALEAMNDATGNGTGENDIFGHTMLL